MGFKLPTRKALRACDGVVESASERELTLAARRADATGLYVCPHTAVGLAALAKQRSKGVIREGETVVVVATAHGLKFTEFKVATAEDRVPHVHMGSVNAPREVPDDFAAVRRAALD